MTTKEIKDLCDEIEKLISYCEVGIASDGKISVHDMLEISKEMTSRGTGIIFQIEFIDNKEYALSIIKNKAIQRNRKNS